MILEPVKTSFLIHELKCILAVLKAGAISLSARCGFHLPPPGRHCSPLAAGSPPTCGVCASPGDENFPTVVLCHLGSFLLSIFRVPHHQGSGHVSLELSGEVCAADINLGMTSVR